MPTGPRIRSGAGRAFSTSQCPWVTHISFGQIGDGGSLQAWSFSIEQSTALKGTHWPRMRLINYIHFPTLFNSRCRSALLDRCLGGILIGRD